MQEVLLDIVVAELEKFAKESEGPGYDTSKPYANQEKHI